MRRAFLLIGISLALFLGLGVSRAFANEGTAFLTSGTTGVRCFAASVLITVDTYQIVMSCRNLIVPQGPELLFYRAWAKRAPLTNQTGQKAPLGGLVRSEYVQLGDLSTGKLASRTRDAFTDLLVTIESDERPKEPNLGRVVASGAIRPLEFGPSPTPGESAPVVREATPTLTVTPVPRGAGANPQSRSVVGTALRVFLVVVGIIVVVAIVISIIQRRSASS